MEIFKEFDNFHRKIEKHMEREFGRMDHEFGSMQMDFPEMHQLSAHNPNSSSNYTFYSKSVSNPDGHYTKQVKEKQGGISNNTKVQETRHGFKDTRHQIDRVAHERVIGNEGYKKVKTNQQGNHQNELFFKNNSRDLQSIDQDWSWHANNLNMKEFKVDHSLGQDDYHRRSGGHNEYPPQKSQKGWAREPEQRQDGVWVSDSAKDPNRPVIMNKEYHKKKTDLKPIQGGGPSAPSYNNGTINMPASLPQNAQGNEQTNNNNFNFNKGQLRQKSVPARVNTNKTGATANRRVAFDG